MNAPQSRSLRDVPGRLTPSRPAPSRPTLSRLALGLSLLLACAPLSAAQSAEPAVSPAPASPVPANPAPANPAPANPVTPAAPAAPARPLLNLPNPLLTFGQVRAALRTSPGWRSAEESYRAAQLTLAAARARSGLNLTVGGDATVGKSPLDTGDWKANATATAGLSATVLPWGSANDPVRSAERALTRAGYDLQDARLNLTLSAAQNYLATRTAAAQQLLTTAQADLAARQLAVAQSQRTAELLSAEGLLGAQGNLDNAQALAQDAAASRSLSERQLLSDLGLGLSDLPLLLPSAPELGGELPAQDGLLERASAGRSEILKATSALEDARAGLASAQRERFPDLSASTSYGELGTGGGGRTLGGSLNFKTGVAGVNLSLPTSRDGPALATGLTLGLSGSFNVLGGPQNAAIASAQSGVSSSELALQSARTSVDLDVRKTYNTAQSTRRLVGVQRTALTRAQTALKSAQARLDAGLITSLDALAAAIAAQSAQVAFEQAVSNAYLAGLQLAKASAGLDPALILTSGAQP
ncbi:TolC family protein [Deinococcus sp.]|uniref:TolC family protein n=1 Tax=Deinococcus sp. TaxID=47478 RepID=UPI0025F9F6AF|nr:TolC family protein [Deinococcus sp.]